ncbi:o-methyltransferase family protein [Diaporthe amygdali]|uniref:o-methyltransferase family protein n=1 Tax=Phomopsis amygdali TaxID=1214568 RepID=UPI0022FDDDAD|nr:o-methyltransferase family protein [Diaporthe amygdali]KAJ0120240.1 o-methyltransferase family protein [Diaporthe amygdali]
MQENVAKLYPNPETSAKVLDYSISKSTALPDWLVKYHEWGCNSTETPGYLISTYEAQSLVFLARLVGAKRVLELGVYIGFSAMVWSHAVGKEGEVVGLELSEKYADIAGKAFKDNGVENVDVKLGDAVESLASLAPSEPFDIIFLDANKDAYPKYLDLILSKSKPGSPGRLLKPGGLIVADNVLRRGIVADTTMSNPHYAEEVARHGEQRTRDFCVALHEFNDKLVAEPRLEAFLVPLFDGLGLARLLD